MLQVDLFRCNVCYHVLAVSSQRKLPDECPVCERRAAGYPHPRLFERVEVRE